MNKFIFIEPYKTYRILNITLKFMKPKIVIVLFLKMRTVESHNQTIYAQISTLKPDWSCDLRPII